MKLYVADMGGERIVSSVDELRDVLSRRHGHSVNDFTLCPEHGVYPALKILVNGMMAVLNFFPMDGHPGFVPDNRANELDPHETTMFYMNTPTEEMPILNTQIVLVADAVKAAEEFATTLWLPKCIRWTEL